MAAKWRLHERMTAVMALLAMVGTALGLWLQTKTNAPRLEVAVSEEGKGTGYVSIA